MQSYEATCKDIEDEECHNMKDCQTCSVDCDGDKVEDKKACLDK